MGKSTKMAASVVNRSAIFAVRLSSAFSNSSKSVVRPLSTTSKWLAESSGITKKMDSDDILKTSQDRKKKMASLITVEGAVDVGTTSGVPDEHLKERYVRVYRPAKNAMQSGTHGIKRWRIEFDARQRWENSLMGWSSSGDPLSNTLVDFGTKEEAIAFVEKNGWDYFVEEAAEKTPKAKSYALNFAWNKRTRKSTK